MNAAYPKARFILTVRNTQSWAESFSATIYKLIAGRDHAPPHMRDWLDMGIGIISKTGFPLGLDVAGLAKAFEAHSEAVKAEIPAERLLVYEVKQGWQPLCKFLGVPVPPDAFPRTNDRADFWERINSVS